MPITPHDRIVSELNELARVLNRSRIDPEHATAAFECIARIRCEASLALLPERGSWQPPGPSCSDRVNELLGIKP